MGHISDVPKQLGASLKHTTEGDFTKLGVEVTGCFNLQDSVMYNQCRRGDYKNTKKSIYSAKNRITCSFNFQQHVFLGKSST